MKTYLFFYLLIILLISSSNTLQCGEEEIEHCLECGTGEKINSCAKCEDKYFPIMSDIICLPCNDPLHGSYGCAGKCEIAGNSYEESRNLQCEEGKCIEGYYQLEGICIPCFIGSPNCANCTYGPIEGALDAQGNPDNSNQFTCLQCINNQYKINNDGRCQHCHNNYCLECHYDENGKSVCDKCEYNFYVGSDGECYKCKWPEYINGGTCTKCASYNTMISAENSRCSCWEHYTKADEITCISCPKNCLLCDYDSSTKIKSCYRCDYGYTLNSEGECVSCGNNCQFCYLDSDKNPICTSCFSGYNLNEDKNCLNCPENCSSCKKDKNDNYQCTYCFSYYGLNNENKCVPCPEHCINCFWKPEKGEMGCSYCEKKNSYYYSDFYKYNYIEDKNDECVLCTSIDEIGGPGCISCSYDRYDKNYKCYACLGDYYYYTSLEKNYAYIYNKYQCLSNLEKNPKNLYGCTYAYYDSKKDIYNCNTCKPGFIPIKGENRCTQPSEINLSSNCIEAENIGTEENPLYSCLFCGNYIYNNQINYIRNNHIVEVTNHLGKMDCFYENNETIHCLEATEAENGDIQCIKCIYDYRFIYSEEYQKNICDNRCELDSFLKLDWCHKCDDKFYGNPGCVLEKGCTFNSANDELDCVECKSGYFRFTQGQCYSCAYENKGCSECHFNTEEPKGFECDKCIDGYQKNERTKKCELILCDEYPEITPGCIICEDKISQYKPNNKCESCKEGFFKTKDESCVYCKARINGGPACEQCMYEKDEEGNDLDNIICNYCPKNAVLSSDGKCYFCKEELGKGCNKCSFVKNEIDNTEKLQCTNCEDYYNLSPNGYCIYYQSYYQPIPHCAKTEYEITKDKQDDYYGSDSPKIDNSTNKNNFTVNAYCILCKNGYYYDYEEKKCEKLDIEECSLMSIISSGIYNKFNGCINYCNSKDFTKINYYLDDIIPIPNNTNNTNNSTYNNTYTNSTNNIFGNNTRTKIDFQMLIKEYGLEKNMLDSLNSNMKSLIINGYLCLGNSGSGKEFEPKNLKKCSISEYIESNDSYICTQCLPGYSLDIETNTCKQSIKIDLNLHPGLSNCYIENIGESSNPIYSCKYCYYEYEDILVKTENGAKFCEFPEYELEGCTEATADTTYLNNNYNCSNCSLNYLPYFSKFFNRKICQFIFSDIIRVNDQFDSTAFDGVENVTAVDGKCENEKFFTPDNQKCYACNSREVGMVGCKGTCTFSTKRNNILECEEGQCKTGYLEKSKGLCEPCNTVNKGCIECHYDSNYLNDYKGLKRKRRFVCDQCEEGFLRAEDGTCHNCTELGFSNCNKCKRDEKNDNDLVCYECLEGFFLDDNYECKKCEESQVRGKGNKCIYCDDAEDGGIEGCESCTNENDKVICSQCKYGFILLENNNTCLKISENSDLEEFPNCDRIVLKENSKLQCTKCISEYILLKENNEIRCVRADFIPSPNLKKNYLCQESINLGTQDKPKYSCSKCSEINKDIYYNNYVINNIDTICNNKCKNLVDFEFEKCFEICVYNKDNEIVEKNTILTKIIFKDNNTAFCDYSKDFEKLENCTEAILEKSNNDVILLNCTKCDVNSTLTYHVDTNSNICRYQHYEKKCVVKYCKTCRTDNNYFCESCLPTDYEVNKITGACVKKTEKVPAITWKDMFRLQMNQERNICGRPVYGPSLMLRGLTNSQINTGHAFLIYMTFKIQYDRNLRTLEEEKKIPTICEVVDSVDETDNDVNVVQYSCIGNLTKYENEELGKNNPKLNNIEEDNTDNEGVMGNSNLNQLAEETDIENLETKTEPTYNLASFLKTTTFIIDEIKNQTSKNYNFDFTLDGKLSKDLSSGKIDIKLPLAQIEKSADCTFNIKGNKNAGLSCKLNVENFKEYDILCFKVTDIEDGDNTIYLSKINEVYLINEHKDKKNYTGLIVGIVCGVVGIAIIIFLIIFFVKKYRNKKIVLDIDNKDIKQKELNNNDYGETEKNNFSRK